MVALQIPTAPYGQFDHLYEELDEFEPLPQGIQSDPLHQEDEDEARAPFDGLILAGLVSPV